MVVRVKRRKTEAELLEIEAFIREGILEARFVPGQRLVENVGYYPLPREPRAATTP